MTPKQLADALEKDFNSQFKLLSKRIAKIEESIYRHVLKTISGSKMSNTYWNSAKVELDLLYRELNKTFSKWARAKIPYQYKRNVTMLAARIKSMQNVTATGRATLASLFKSRATTQIVRGLYDSSVQTFISASLSGKTNIRNLFVQTQQALINESFINVEVASGFEMGNLREAKKLLTAVFESKAWKDVNGRAFVQAGNRKYTARYYAEMVARTKFHQAQAQAAIAQAKNHDTDLVQVSSHNTSTPICIPFEGQMYSLSGETKGFEILPESPPFHPNCLHLLFPAFESALIADGSLQQWKDFSSGKLDKPPYPSNFIPISERDVI